ncbi:MAG: alcohol dehydrogenase catalytic domain-containing protein [Kurthia sp.]|nr:alcohol dehydrogenase catalytic domain-containing protein [Candidatus Kurthia equi]
MKVKAAVVNQVNGPYEFEELDLQEINHDEVVVKVVASGICHSDEALRVGDAESPFPAVLGHEGAGIVEQVGSSVKNFKVGDQVVMAYNSCGTCQSCRTGHPSSCNDWAALNMGGVRSDRQPVFKKADGTPVSNFFSQSSFSTYTVTNVNNLIKVSDDADLRIIGPLGCGFLTGAGTVVNGLKPKVGDSIPQFAIPKLIEFHQQGKFAFDKLVKFYKFDEINEASADSNSGVTIKPILIIDETYRAGEPLPS